MKACVIRKDNVSLEGIQVVDLPRPEPGPQEVLIRTCATSLNFRDYLIVTDNYGAAQLLEDAVLLSDAAGEVTAVGSAVTRFRTGDRVAGTFFQVWKDGPKKSQPPALGVPLPGVHAEFICLHEDGVVLIPDCLSFEEAASLPCAGVTAWNATMVSGRPVSPGDTVLCLGIGVGSTRMFEDMNRAIAINRIKPVIDRVFSFDETVDAFRLLASRNLVGKIVIRF